jgi:hypothetical protein
MTTLDDWMGQRVKVQLAMRESEVVPCVLEGVSDKGIVVRYRVQGEGERPVFYPWRLVEWIYPAAGAEEESGEDSAEPATDTRRRQWGAGDR